jgi:hypothetical protein
MSGRASAWGWSWVALIVTWVIHIADEIAGDALAFYNPWIRSVTGHELTFGVWITVLTVILVALSLIAPLVFRGAKSLTLPVAITATLMLLNSGQHLILLLALQRFTPGTRSAPLLGAAALWVLRETWRASPRGLQS